MRLNKISGIAAATFFSGALVLGLATAAGAAPDLGLGSLTGSLGADNADNCDVTEFSTPDNTLGWGAPSDETAATYGAVTPVGVFGADALKFAQSEKGTSLYKGTGEKGIALSSLVDADGELTDIGYSYLTDGQAPALQLRIIGANYETTGDGFATIVWSPADGDGTEWQQADPGKSDQYWVTRAIDGVDGVRDGLDLARGEHATLKEIIAMNPEATLIAYGVQQTKENAATNVAVDGFVFGCTTTDFEAKAEAPAGPFASLTGLFGSLS